MYRDSVETLVEHTHNINKKSPQLFNYQNSYDKIQNSEMKNDKILVHQNYMDEFKSDLDEEIKVIHNKPFIDKYNMMQSNLYSSENYLTIQNKEINYDKIISSECLEIDNFSNQSPDIHLNLKIGDDSEDKQVFQSLFDPNCKFKFLKNRFIV